MSMHQLCTFAIHGGLFGVEVRRVQEVLRHQEITRVTLARRIIRGLINLRGQIVMAIDLRRALELPELAEGESMNLVVRGDEGPVSFLVDKIMDVIDVDESTFEPPPPNLHPPTRRIVRGSYTCGGRVLLLIDADAVLSLLESSDER